MLGWEREAAHKPAGLRTNSEHVLGLTTAASIWATAAIGIAAGLGHFVVAVGSAMILLIVLRGMARFERDDR